VGALRIYVDLDDVLSHTIEQLSQLLEREFGRRVEPEAVMHFDLSRSFGLSPAELEAFFAAVHRPEALAALAPRAGAARALRAWTQRGYEVSVVSGRPPSTAADSRAWLDRHGIPHAHFACVDKYGRADPGAGTPEALRLADLTLFGFALAVEDSLEVASHLALACRVPVVLMDRPWNRDVSGVDPAAAACMVRCRDWLEIAARFPTP
jgi:uncharacterized HAD superfamily protein